MQYVDRVNYGINKEGDLDEIKVNSIGIGLTVGYQWVSSRGFVVEIFHGGVDFPLIRSGIQCGMAPWCRV